MVEANKYGKTILCMKAIGRIIRQTAEGDLFIPTVMYMRENGLTTKLTVEVSTTIMMALVIRASGLKISSRDSEFKSGTTDHLIKGNF